MTTTIEKRPRSRKGAGAKLALVAQKPQLAEVIDITDRHLRSVVSDLSEQLRPMPTATNSLPVRTFGATPVLISVFAWTSVFPGHRPLSTTRLLGSCEARCAPSAKQDLGNE